MSKNLIIYYSRKVLFKKRRKLLERKYKKYSQGQYRDRCRVHSEGSRRRSV